MRRSPFTHFCCCLTIALLAGCASSFPGSGRVSRGLPSFAKHSSTHAPKLQSRSRDTVNKPIVRNQNAAVHFGGVAQAGYNAPHQPMPISGQASRIATTPPRGTTSNEDIAQTQFTNPAGAAQGNQAWALPPQATQQQIRQQLAPKTAAGPANAAGYQPPQSAPRQPTTFQVAQAPPAGYPGAPQFPGAAPQLSAPQYSAPQYRAPQSPAVYNAQQSAPGLWSQQPQSTRQPARQPYGSPSLQPEGPPTSFANSTPPKIPLTKAPSTPNAPSGGSNQDWSPTVPRVSQVTPPNASSVPSGGIPSASLSPATPAVTPPLFQGNLPQSTLPPGNPPPSGISQTVPPQAGTISPPIGGWPQAFGTPQPPGTPGGMIPPSQQFADVIVNVQETQTGRFMIGAAVNSDAGLTGQIVIDEQNFDWRAWPNSVEDFLNGQAFRGGGQRLRIEALPGDEVQRYMIQFSEPYLAGTRITFNLSGYFFDRRYFDWDENRLGVRTGLGYRISPDLSIAGGIRAERVRITDPRVPVGTVPELDEALGQSELYSGNISLTHDTRDISFAPTQGHYFRFNYDQVFGSFDYGRGEIDWRRYFLVTERPDGSGRHVLGFSNKFSLSGSETPIYENFFAGGHATLRGFEFRGASPEVASVTVGGRMMFLGSVEYLFPITADDMLKGVVFCDYGTVEEDTDVDWNDFRVALGAGLRVSIAAMGPAPIALDFAVPVSKAGTDDTQSFSFFVGVSR